VAQKIKLEEDLNRPWGGFIKFIENKSCTVKVLQIKSGEELSLQSHQLREEFWYVISGKVKVTLGKNLKSLKNEILKEGEFVQIPRKNLHRAKGMTKPYSKILEISTGKFKENDELRYEDKYRRKSPE
jgi:mannose-6-phosphate isomerase-like protein (cupin superfamily)